MPSHLQIEPELLLCFRSPERVPLSISVSLKRIYRILYILAFTFLALSLMSLLFFKELEKNRLLTQELLALRVAKLVPTIAPPISTTSALPEKTVSVETTTKVSTRLTDFDATCEEGKCTTRVGLVPSKTGLAEGGILILLEVEMIRIGSQATETEARKSYLAYPTQSVPSNLTDDSVASLQRKPFHFSRALQTTADFTPKNSERPVAAHVYVYNSDGELTLHDRKPLEIEDATH